jgi:hypothetical protein
LRLRNVSTSGKKKTHTSGTFTICPAVVATWGKDYINETWSEVLNDLLDGQNLCIKMTVTTCLSDKILGTVTFTPDMEEPIRLVKL